jgi:L-amino acid N-acyltransferase YncA
MHSSPDGWGRLAANYGECVFIALVGWELGASCTCDYPPQRLLTTQMNQEDSKNPMNCFLSIIRRKIVSAQKLLRERGIAQFLSRIRDYLWSGSELWLVEHEWHGDDTRFASPPPGVIFRPATRADIPDIVKNWPPEFEHLPAHELTLNIDMMFNNGFLCFLAEDNEGFMGVLWVKPWNLLLDNALPEKLRGRPAFESHKLFVPPAARGKKLGARLLSYMSQQMAEKGLPITYGRIRHDRKASLSLHKMLGYKCLGTISSVYRFGFRLVRFTPVSRLKNTPFGDGD